MPARAEGTPRRRRTSSRWMRTRGWRWVAVAAFVGVLCAAPSAVGALPAKDSDLSAEQLRDLVRASASVGWSGTNESRAGLALPDVERPRRPAGAAGRHHPHEGLVARADGVPGGRAAGGGRAGRHRRRRHLHHLEQRGPDRRGADRRPARTAAAVPRPDRPRARPPARGRPGHRAQPAAGPPGGRRQRGRAPGRAARPVEQHGVRGGPLGRPADRAAARGRAARAGAGPAGAHDAAARPRPGHARGRADVLRRAAPGDAVGGPGARRRRADRRGGALPAAGPPRRADPRRWWPGSSRRAASGRTARGCPPSRSSPCRAMSPPGCAAGWPRSAVRACRPRWSTPWSASAPRRTYLLVGSVPQATLDRAFAELQAQPASPDGRR